MGNFSGSSLTKYSTGLGRITDDVALWTLSKKGTSDLRPDTSAVGTSAKMFPGTLMR